MPGQRRVLQQYHTTDLRGRCKIILSFTFVLMAALLLFCDCTSSLVSVIIRGASSQSSHYHRSCKPHHELSLRSCCRLYSKASQSAFGKKKIQVPCEFKKLQGRNRHAWQTTQAGEDKKRQTSHTECQQYKCSSFSHLVQIILHTFPQTHHKQTRNNRRP